MRPSDVHDDRVDRPHSGHLRRRHVRVHENLQVEISVLQLRPKPQRQRGRAGLAFKEYKV